MRLLLFVVSLLAACVPTQRDDGPLELTYYYLQY
jgi:hypothetical protein